MYRVRNGDGLTPLQLAAALGQKRMFQHMLDASCRTFWTYGPVSCVLYPLSDLDGVYGDRESATRSIQQEAEALNRAADILAKRQGQSDGQALTPAEGSAGEASPNDAPSPPTSCSSVSCPPR